MPWGAGPGASEHMAEADRFGAQVALVVVVGREDVRHPFGDRDAALGEAFDLVRIVGEQAHRR